jgi:hypothetical protein
MPRKTLRIGIIAERRPPVTRWGKPVLRPSAVLAIEPGTPPATKIGSEGEVETWYLGGRDLVLHSGDTGHHLDNLDSRRPSVWVALRGGTPETVEIVAVTVDPYEGEGLATDPDLMVEAVPMPARLQEIVAAFATLHHVEIPFKKRKRTPASRAGDPGAPRVLQPDQKWGAKTNDRRSHGEG